MDTKGSSGQRMPFLARAAPLGIVLVLATALRLHRLGFAPITSDESFSWRLIQYPLADTITRTAADVHPPLYYLLTQLWTTLWGSSMLALRSFSVIMCVIALRVCCRDPAQQTSHVTFSRKAVRKKLGDRELVTEPKSWSTTCVTISITG